LWSESSRELMVVVSIPGLRLRLIGGSGTVAYGGLVTSDSRKTPSGSTHPSLSQTSRRDDKRLF
jgi:hypothetical protein